MIKQLIGQIAFFLLFVTVSFAQENVIVSPLTVESESVDVETNTQTIEATRVQFGDVTLDSDSKVIGETTGSVKAVLITSSEIARNVAAFNTAFDAAQITKVDDNRYLLTGSPGKYLVIIDTINGSTIRPVVLESSGPDVSELALLSADLARRLNDPTTQARLAEELSTPILANDLTAAKAEIQTRIETVLSQRAGESRYVDWLNGWRRPLQVKLAEYELTVEPYSEAIAQVAAGLSAQSNSISAAQVINPIVPMSANLPPAWDPPSPPFQVGQIHNGRVLRQLCRGDGKCEFVWRILYR